MALYELSEHDLQMLRPADEEGNFALCDEVGKPLTPGQAIVAALFPALDADVRDALGELVDVSRCRDFMQIVVTIDVMACERCMGLYPLAMVETWRFSRLRGFAETPTATAVAEAVRTGDMEYHSGPALIPAIKAVTERLR